MILTDKNFLRFTAVFLVVFCICYYGTLAVIGLSTPGGRYNAFVENFNYVDNIRASLLSGTKMLLSLFGYGVMSFWIAYTVAAKASLKKKILWLAGGLTALWLINIIRLSLVLSAAQYKWKMPFGMDHHTWFNIVAYGAIFLMIYLFEKNIGKIPSRQINDSTGNIKNN
jgi:exosortase/archaeosortase family protein